MARLKFPGVGKNSSSFRSPKKRLVLRIKKKKGEKQEFFNVGVRKAISEEEFHKIFGDSDEEVRVVILCNLSFHKV